ncbi:MAG: hypothetical protein Q8N10_04150 [Phenylobacterium sp.]|uniref:Phage holin family protein n=1 Tax=Phenylobacterium ferrooxidans TaxID=2982689 RepID=A0ABW6CUV2_9CAUL|nr:hypothetical protein [Phenylobacterium sp.]MDO8324170.1 hypothetical protein [Phenylobacterium sp.]MDO8911062.1 hypothetical protein [Phenylobacterium sp.]MDO9249141.1 hypothetical protein [Phenylobacterium sp.]MDP2009853.1 hypothetical protein [Phenylobacterium sp.]MDP3099675.1 hypothetical protein [Phenylobacterium sp.]
MIFKKAVLYVSAVSALGAAAVVVVVALAFTLYAAVLPQVGPAWAAASVAGAAAVLMALCAMALLIKVNPPRLGKQAEERDTLTRLIDLAKEKPIVAASAIIGASLVALRNPKIVATVLATAMATRSADKAKKK